MLKPECMILLDSLSQLQEMPISIVLQGLRVPNGSAGLATIMAFVLDWGHVSLMISRVVIVVVIPVLIVGTPVVDLERLQSLFQGQQLLHLIVGEGYGLILRVPRKKIMLQVRN